MYIPICSEYWHFCVISGSAFYVLIICAFCENIDCLSVCAFLRHIYMYFCGGVRLHQPVSRRVRMPPESCSARAKRHSGALTRRGSEGLMARDLPIDFSKNLFLLAERILKAFLHIILPLKSSSSHLKSC